MPRHCDHSPAPGTPAAFDSRVRSATGTSCRCEKQSGKPGLAAAEICCRRIKAAMTIADIGNSISLRVSRQEFAALKDGLKPATRPMKNEGAALSFVNGKLGIKSAGKAVSILASGNWPGVAHVPLAFILTALRNSPAQDPLLVTVRDSRLHIGHSSITCHWHAQQARGRTNPPPRVIAPAYRFP